MAKPKVADRFDQADQFAKTGTTGRPTTAKKARAKAKMLPKPNRAQGASQGASGLVPEGDVRLTANIRGDLHLRLKIEAAKQRTTIGELVEELVDKHIP